MCTKLILQQIKGFNPELKNITLKGVIVPLNDKLGQGAYGTVFTVKYDSIVCAAKKIHPILIENVQREEKQRIKNKFIQACLCCSSVQHPNIVQFLGVYYPLDQSDFPVMVMELMSTNLTSFVENNKSKITFWKKIPILYNVSLGLNFLHSHKPQILHQDLSPNNIMLTNHHLAKIGDLGMAQMVRADSKQTKGKLTKLSGTPHFMPPEALVKDNPVYSTPVDVFSFGGITLHVFSEEWLTPSSYIKKDPVTKMLVALTEAERRQQYLDKMTGKAAALRKTIEDCLDNDPDKRPPIQEVSTTIKPLWVSITISHSTCMTSHVLIKVWSSGIKHAYCANWSIRPSFAACFSPRSLSITKCFLYNSYIVHHNHAYFNAYDM